MKPIARVANMLLKWTGHQQHSASTPQVPYLPLRVSDRRIARLVRLRILAFIRAYGRSGYPIWVMHRTEHVVIGPANHAYVCVAFANEYCTPMALRISSAMQQRGSRKCGTLGAWFSEPPNKELDRLKTISHLGSQSSNMGTSRLTSHDKNRF
jgi:hypothetical protein